MSDTDRSSLPFVPERSYPAWARLCFAAIPLVLWMFAAFMSLIGNITVHRILVVETLTSWVGLWLSVELLVWSIMPRFKGWEAIPGTALSYRKRMMVNFIGQVVVFAAGTCIFIWSAPPG